MPVTAGRRRDELVVEGRWSEIGEGKRTQHFGDGNAEDDCAHGCGLSSGGIDIYSKGSRWSKVIMMGCC